MTGKTTLARALAREYAGEEQQIIVYDPVGSGTFGGDWPKDAIIYDNEDDLWRLLEHPGHSRAHVFIDEAGDVFSLSKPENQWLLRKGRHFGYAVTLISQRPKMIAPNVRSQVGRIYMFRLATDDSREILADMGFDFSDSGLKEKPLDKGDFLVLDSGNPVIYRANVFQLLRRKLPWNRISRLPS